MPIIKKCSYCGKEIKIKPSHNKEFNYCCKECYSSHSLERLIIKIEKEKNIDLKEWIYQKYVVEKISLIKISEMLKVSNRTPPRLLEYYGIDKNTRSQSIANQWINNEARKIETSKRAKINLNTKEARQKLSEIMKTEEYRKKQSLSKLGEKNGMYGKYGILNPYFNPNISIQERMTKRNYSTYRIWRFKVYKRDNFTCQCCGDDKGHNLNAHHLNCYSDFPTQRSKLENGVCLCENCHKLFHKIYGNKHNTKEQFVEFINNNKY